MAKRGWESSPWTWMGIVVVSGVVTAVVSAYIQKMAGLKISQKTVPAQGQPQANLGKYMAVF